MILVRRHEWCFAVVEQLRKTGDDKPDQDKTCHPTREDAQCDRDHGGYGHEARAVGNLTLYGAHLAIPVKKQESAAQTESKHQCQTELLAAAGHGDHQDVDGRRDRQKDVPRVCPELREALKQRVVATVRKYGCAGSRCSGGR